MTNLTHIRALVLQGINAVDVVTLGASLVIAETFYKLHSFTLEAGAFLATWYGLRLVARAIFRDR
ncbi:MAG: hypothetical protein A3G84_06480 [Chloroflexi bacterium RIFCSPLOWO2_12_FULL_71_12]|nr:MAG: hypothetical protein A3G84_06480 [Chloroflexi bacterium RIFCSPLOWO2_12_FULL_71_12]